MPSTRTHDEPELDAVPSTSMQAELVEHLVEPEPELEQECASPEPEPEPEQECTSSSQHVPRSHEASHGTSSMVLRSRSISRKPKQKPTTHSLPFG